ncbi:MAG: S8 family serine peptidase [Gaiellaceae bacterium]
MLGRAGLITAVPACALVAAVAHAAVPSDPLTQNAVFEAVGLPRAWDVTTGAQDVVIAVVDSGVDASHPDLAGAADEGYDFVDGDSGAAPLVAGIAALLRAHAPFATVSQIDSALARTARPVAGVRFGLLDAYAALQALGQPAPRFEPTIEGAADVGETLTAHTGIWAGARIELRVRLATLPRRELRNGRHGSCVPRPFGRPWHRVAGQCFRPRRADGGLRTDRGRARARAEREASVGHRPSARR